MLFNLFFDKNRKIVKKYAKIVNEINLLEESIVSLSSEELGAKTRYFRKCLSEGLALNDIIVEALAVIREASKRVLGLRPFDVQLIGAIVLHEGKIAEMKTGEGKTLVAICAAYLNALEQNGVHIVTVNDYLAKRDAEWMGAILKLLNISVGCVTSDSSDSSRIDAYACDVLYITNNELGFDYLRDNMKYDLSQVVMKRGMNFVIIDEVDSILIDEARTPLIISGVSDADINFFHESNKIAYALSEECYEIKEDVRSISLTDKGLETLEIIVVENNVISEEDSLYSPNNIKYLHHVTQALKAHKLFSKDVDYIIKDKQVVIIDEFTGRTMEGRRYSDGLHQAIEAKENLVIQQESRTLASITYQNIFRMYNKISGMTGTAKTEEKELNAIYNLEVIQIPTNNTIQRTDEDDVIYATQKEKYGAIIELVKSLYETQQPVLIGTVSIGEIRIFV